MPPAPLPYRSTWGQDPRNNTWAVLRTCLLVVIIRSEEGVMSRASNTDRQQKYSCTHGHHLYKYSKWRPHSWLYLAAHGCKTYLNLNLNSRHCPATHDSQQNHTGP
jgi:hypothetical protein